MRIRPSKIILGAYRSIGILSPTESELDDAYIVTGIQSLEMIVDEWASTSLMAPFLMDEKYEEDDERWDVDRGMVDVTDLKPVSVAQAWYFSGQSSQGRILEIVTGSDMRQHAHTPGSEIFTGPPERVALDRDEAVLLDGSDQGAVGRILQLRMMVDFAKIQYGGEAPFDFVKDRAMDLPAGYSAALQWELASALHTQFFSDRPLPREIAMRRDRTVANLKARNQSKERGSTPGRPAFNTDYR